MRSLWMIIALTAPASAATWRWEHPTPAAGPMHALWGSGETIYAAGARGGMLVSRDPAKVQKARFWSTQARDPGIGYEHSEMGYNYRLSNVLAGIGRGQLLVLDDRVRRRREIAFHYRDALADIAGISLMPQAPYGLHTNWLSCFLVDADRFGCDRDELIRALDSAGIEARSVWKPMHMQPLFRGVECVGGKVAEDVHRRGICLPSSSSLTDEEQQRVIDAVRAAHSGR